MMENIKGEFKITLAGKERTMRASFDVVEQLEGGLLRLPIYETLANALNGRISVREMAATFHAGLSANKDTRLSAKEVGQALVEDGSISFVEKYIELLTYLMTGGKKPKEGEPGEELKTPDTL